MFIKSPTGFIDIFNIDIDSFAKGYLLAKGIDYFLKRINFSEKSRNFYFDLIVLKYQILGSYAYWKTSRKSNQPNPPMSKLQLQCFIKQLLAEVKNQPTKEEEQILYMMIRNAYPLDLIRKHFGETRGEIKSKLDIEEFFQNVFA